MQESELELLFNALRRPAEVMGTELKPASIMLMTDDLADYPLDSVLSALKRCRREISGRLTLAAIVERGPDFAKVGEISVLGRLIL